MPLTAVSFVSFVVESFVHPQVLAGIFLYETIRRISFYLIVLTGGCVTK